jgi:two-component system chemotaxis response regulator CheB
METKRLLNATCPDCRGPLSEIDTDGLHEYRCLVGHAYAARTLLQSHSAAQEKALWSAVVALEESAKLVDAVEPEMPPDVIERLRQQAIQKQKQADEIRKVIEQLEPFQTE